MHFVFRVFVSVQIVFYDYDRLSADDKAFHFWFNTAFVYNNYLRLHKDVIDRACKDKGSEFDADFQVRVLLTPQCALLLCLWQWLPLVRDDDPPLHLPSPFSPQPCLRKMLYQFHPAPASSLVSCEWGGGLLAGGGFP